MKTSKNISPLYIFALAGLVVGGIILTRRIFRSKQKKLTQEAEKDIKFWEDKKETSPLSSNVLVSYWKSAGYNLTPKQMQDSSVHAKYPWSSAYVSNLIPRAGYKNFKGHPTHSGYVLDAKSNRVKKLDNSFWAYKPSEQKKVEVGDILVKPRSGTNPTLDNLKLGTATHGDVVIKLTKQDGKNIAQTVGGNVGDKVKITDVELNSDNTLKDQSLHFAHLKYKD